MNDKRGREGKKVKEKEEKKKKRVEKLQRQAQARCVHGCAAPQKKRRRRERDGRKQSQKSGAHVRTFARSHVRTGGWERLRTAEAMSDTSFSSCARKTLISSSASTFACFIRIVLPARSTETTTDQSVRKVHTNASCE